MFQSFDATTRPGDGPPRLAALRAELARRRLAGFLVPRADAHQGEYVAPRDDRLAWLTGFTGSAGFCIVLPEVAGVFVDGRYRLQVRAQCDGDAFTPVNWPEVKPGAWLRDHAPKDAAIGFDPWLHTPDELARLRDGLAGSGITLQAVPDNPLDAIWPDQPAPPAAPVTVQPEALAGRASTDKRADLAKALRARGQRAAVITLPDSLCWLLNIRGADVPRNPVAHGFAVLHDSGRVDLFMDPGKLAGVALDGGVVPHPADALLPTLAGLAGPVRIDPASAPVAVADALAAAGIEVVHGRDPCALPKACKTEAELDGARAAQRRDGAAMATFLHWLDGQIAQMATAPDSAPTEIDLVRQLEACRRATNALEDISFDTIAGSGPNGAIIHYRVTDQTDRRLQPGDVLVIDSGGQYRDGTTDITRTIAVGTPPEAARAACTRVLQGMIAMSRARFPRGVTGAHLDALARFPLWLAGQDYDHGTGHGVGSFLSVHEGPQRLSRTSDVALAPGMIVSNEPGFYRPGAFGIRIENLIAVRVADPLPGGDDRDVLDFETLTLAPIDRRMLVPDMLNATERDWLNAYHARVLAEIGPLVGTEVRAWLEGATAPI